ncbi:MAG: peptidase, partial [Bacteroidetes bacterium]|nr:peptidase [Bacteroidota bacterium]
EEWKGTPEALTVSRAFQMTASLPYPKATILFSIESRSYETGLFVPIFKLYINPTSIFISRKEVDFYPSYRLSGNGDPSRSVDIAFIPEGYTKQEMDKFERDARRISAYILAQPPFEEYINRINIFIVLAPSSNSGVGIAGDQIYPNTSVNSGFYTFGMDRYLTTSETWAVYDIAANVPYDHVFILANSSRYGGGGFYNHYSMSTADNSLSEIVSIHEFGHGFGGLADEYYTSEVAYSDMYNLKIEPWEPNITTNVNFTAKWKSMISDTIPLPTPREAMYSKVVGLFEGGGYSAKGIFSPVMDCRMKSNDAKGFCPVCREAIRKKIQSLCD